MDYSLLGYCGIDCSHCEVRRAALDTVFAVEFADMSQSWCPGCTPDSFKCRGCKGSVDFHWSPKCAILICASGKDLDHCGQCPDFKCQLIIDFQNDPYEHHSEAVKNLERLRGEGELGDRS